MRESRASFGSFSTIPRRVKWLIFAGLFNNIGIGYLLVYLTAFFPQIGVSPGVVGLLLGLEGVMLFLSIPLGIRSDRRGRKKILLIGSTVVPIPMIMMALTVNVPILVVAALLFGVAESAFLATWNAMIADQTDLTNRDASFSLSFIVSGGGVAFGFLLPFFLPLVAAMTGIGIVPIHRDLLVLVGVLSFFTPLMVYATFKNYKETISPRKLIRGPNFRILLKFSGINSIIGLGAGFIIPLIPTWLFLEVSAPRYGERTRPCRLQSYNCYGCDIEPSNLETTWTPCGDSRDARSLYGIHAKPRTGSNCSSRHYLVHNTCSSDEHGISAVRLVSHGDCDAGRERPSECD